MANFTPITKDLISIGSVETGQMADIAENITSLRLSLTSDQASELSFSVVDPNFEFARNNYFQIRRDVFYRELIFEVARVEIGRSQSIHPEYRLVCYNKNVQMMKRDKKPEAYRGISASDYVRTVANRFNMNVFVQETTKKQSIVKGSSNNSDENVWDVLQRSAADAEFLCFEIDNCLFFCSQTFLLGKWGDPSYQFMGNFFIPFGWPDNDEKAFPGSSQKYILLDMPTFTRSENDPMDAEGTLTVERSSGVHLRPGMTVNITGIPDFENGYLITDVSFDEGTADPVRVNFRTPVKPSKGQKGKIGTSDSGTVNTGLVVSSGETETVAVLDPAIISAIQDFVSTKFPRFRRDETEAQRNAKIQQQSSLANSAAARIAAIPDLAQREQALIAESVGLGLQNAQIALAALQSVSKQLIDGPAPIANTSGFPTNGILSAQPNLGLGAVTAPVTGQILSAEANAGVGLISRTVSVVVVPTVDQVVPDLAGRLPQDIRRQIGQFVSVRGASLQPNRRLEIVNRVTTMATIIYNQVTVRAKLQTFTQFVDSTFDVVTRDALISIKSLIIISPPSAVVNVGIPMFENPNPPIGE